MPTLNRWQVAVHEAAHAMFARDRSRAIIGVSVAGVAGVACGPSEAGSEYLGYCYYPGVESLDPLERCTLSLVGYAAMYRTDWPEPVLADLADLMQSCEGCPSECNCDHCQVLAKLREVNDPEAFYEKARARAEAFVDEAWSDITRVAGRLMETTHLDGDDLDTVFDPAWPEFRGWLDEIRRADDTAPWVLREEADEED